MIQPILKRLASVKRKVQRAANFDKKNIADEIRGAKANTVTSIFEKHLEKLLGFSAPETKLDSNHASSLVIAQTTFTSKAKNILANLLTLSIITDAVNVAGTPEVQHIAFSAVPTSGNWSVAMGIVSTSSLAFNAAAATVQAALRLIPGLETVVVTGDYTAGFTLTMAAVDYPLLTVASDTLLATATPVTITITQTTQGVPAVDTRRVDVVGSDIKVHCLVGATNADVKALIDGSSASDLITVSIAAGQTATVATTALDKPFTGGL